MWCAKRICFKTMLQSVIMQYSHNLSYEIGHMSCLLHITRQLRHIVSINQIKSYNYSAVMSILNYQIFVITSLYSLHVPSSPLHICTAATLSSHLPRLHPLFVISTHLRPLSPLNLKPIIP